MLVSFHCLIALLEFNNVNVGKFSLFYSTARIWNSLFSYIVTSPNCYIFNERLTDTYSLPVM